MPLIVKYAWNGTEPQLAIAEGNLNEKERQELASEVQRKYAQLVHKDKQSVSFETRLKGLPQPLRFYVRVQPGQSDRCPNLLLQHVPTSSANLAQPETDLTGWVRAFLEDVEDLLTSKTLSEANTAERAAFRFTIKELQHLGQGQSSLLAPILFAGYVILAGRMCKTFDHDRAGLYRLSARMAEKLFCSMITDEVGEQDDTGEVAPVSKLHWTVQYLGSLLGLCGQ